MNKLSKILIFILISGWLIIVPFLINASGLVPCGQADTPPCQLCHFLILIRNVINFILKVLIPLGILFIVIGAIIILISRGTQIATRGKKIIRTALFAVIIALVAGIVIDTIIAFIANPNVFPLPWNALDIPCP